MSDNEVAADARLRDILDAIAALAAQIKRLQELTETVARGMGIAL